MTYEEIVKEIKDAAESADASSVKEHVALQFNIWGEAEGSFYLEIADGKVHVEPYEYYDRDVLVTVSVSDLMQIFSGKKDFIDLFNSGDLKAEGNLIKALALKDVLAQNTGAKKSMAQKAKSAVAAAKAVKKAAKAKK